MALSTAGKRTSALASALHRMFAKSAGFKKHGLTFNRRTQRPQLDPIHVINVQGSQGNFGDQCEVYINLGADFLGISGDEDRRIWKEENCAFRERAGERWVVGDDIERTAGDIVKCLQTDGAAFFERHSDAKSLLADLERRAIDTGVGLGHLGTFGTYRRISALWVALGEPQKARLVLEGTLRFLAKERPHADPTLVHRFARGLGITL